MNDDLPLIAKSKAMNVIFDFLLNEKVLEMQMVCKRWYSEEISQYYH